MPSRLAPSRYHLAFSRLIAVLLLLAGKKEDRSHVRYLSFVRGQSPLEVYSYSLAWFLLADLFLLAVVQTVSGIPTWTLLPMFIILIPVTFALLSAFTFSVGLMIIELERLGLIATRRHERTQFLFHHVAISTTAAWSVLQPGWIRYVGLSWLAMLLVNMIAAIVLMSLSRVVADLERRHGKTSQAVPFVASREICRSHEDRPGANAFRCG